ncbi:hypothetical protein BASA50_002552 [Batrachochytrium salamandrivorans]|uniref:Uncharacterized protein n=1 Tax=Batrachochytrium salamandrivorans TaxID=1357716 RepID=A0ABQ8FLE4_9FUNG|nr:hypothetical protein BASA62_008485 [Batrachochytrium salamandrivorans]KAH6569023.1 hypothetical protein BASA60_008358 [Batrachochytrium salamandrivorans]KAH6578993.1 hypothetical protein BASA61_010521 [Batrachochytrium salamandrivorans]KAH6600094.1 hypothetical protein BASA50_002552 [Batrachochytrium salamandrivorans]KAH9266015.1 hypothetical protein BASA84_001282 [Batrachochytrium salamandrivorans]
MKFQALVVAAMVVTSVNAGLLGKLPSEAENSGDESGSVSEQNLLQNDSDPSQDPEPTKEKQAGDLSDEDKKNQICNSILLTLYGLRGQIIRLAHQLRVQMLIINDLNIKRNHLYFWEIPGHFLSKYEARAELQSIENKYATVMGEYYQTWQDLTGSGCPTESLKSMFPKEMIDIDVFLSDELRLLYNAL